jgi:hypothetical protein
MNSNHPPKRKYAVGCFVVLALAILIIIGLNWMGNSGDDAPVTAQNTINVDGDAAARN